MYAVPVYKFLQNERLVYAHKLLKDDNLSIMEISLVVEYTNPGRFAQLFKQKYEYLPSKFINFWFSYYTRILMTNLD
ncbi:MAG: hypothetical protein COB24_09365 [Hyphomicrobiales bacterium]|nr:MAG: hypothetical protein COB24_09365 [Hyphomicrobiales bacterium]